MLDVLLFSLAVGGAYSLMSAGFNLMMGASRLVNLAYGAQMTLTSYIMFSLSKHFDPLLSALLAIAASIPISLLIWIPLKMVKRDLILSIVLSLAIAILIEGAIYKLYGSSVISVPFLVEASVAGFSAQWIVAIAVSTVSIALFYSITARTLTGKKILAVSENRELGILMGFDVDMLDTIAYMIGVVFLSLAAVVLSPIYSIYPHIGWYFLTLVLTISIIGGLGSSWGSMAASYLLAFAQNLSSYYLGPVVQQIIPLVLVVIILLYRPEGIFGKGVRWA